jgi:hypothetical protein
VKGQDISNPLVLDEFGIPDGSDLDQIMGEWEAAWHETGQAGVPLVVSPGGVLLVGCVPTEQIQAFFSLPD